MPSRRYLTDINKNSFFFPSLVALALKYTDQILRSVSYATLPAAIVRYATSVQYPEIIVVLVRNQFTFSSSSTGDTVWCFFSDRLRFRTNPPSTGRRGRNGHVTQRNKQPQFAKSRDIAGRASEKKFCGKFRIVLQFRFI
ncbi:hypothetical protein CEXT_71841 [Caerostris extrusa]|uniref:Uncharacterized protein n=1 Tax=Caerostris extrusa TaxID=172846 RepID=A0AAV4NIW0_CAEEX|nr:hypothetical protein CEXT_71841 [Caerostris extrusa]